MTKELLWRVVTTLIMYVSQSVCVLSVSGRKEWAYLKEVGRNVYF
ncbi:hypothetical protein [Bacillus thuringiensis]|nr:hypothetical protein [Bacillus thuringiensis]